MKSPVFFPPDDEAAVYQQLQSCCSRPQQPRSSVDNATAPAADGECSFRAVQLDPQRNACAELLELRFPSASAVSTRAPPGWSEPLRDLAPLEKNVNKEA